LEPERIRTIVKQSAVRIDEGYLILRAQSRREVNLKFNNGQIENISTGHESGLGVQAFTLKGASGFASANVIEERTAEQLITKAFNLALENERIGCELNNQIFSAPKTCDELPSKAKYAFDKFSPEDLQAMIALIHGELLEVKPDRGSIAWQTFYRQIEDFWCIGRTDGTLVSFFVPRAVLFHQGTIKQGDQGQSFAINRSGVDAQILLAEKEDRVLQKQALEKTDFIQRISLASRIPFGSYPLVIDYGLAKGLAHEAFGHAVESDLMEESVLGENGKLRRNLGISGRGVDIIDGSLEGDWAYQPYSANGLRRETVAIVKDGILKQGLGDIFSAQKAGVGVSDAGRAESFDSIPLPRMTNIRLLTAEVIPLPPSNSLKEEIQTLRAVMELEGLLEKDNHFLLLGYRGGQVNIKTGDFVFQCDGAVNLADPALQVYQPGIFSGEILSVLKSVKISLGQEQYNAIGTCGKAGQMVPSSGGGSGYIILEKNEKVKLGGSKIGR
jgi:TldD protein